VTVKRLPTTTITVLTGTPKCGSTIPPIRASRTAMAIVIAALSQTPSRRKRIPTSKTCKTATPIKVYLRAISRRADTPACCAKAPASRANGNAAMAAIAQLRLTERRLPASDHFSEMRAHSR
jgi:hypothetical protein